MLGLQLWSINCQGKLVLPEYLEPLGTWRAEACPTDTGAFVHLGCCLHTAPLAKTPVSL